VKRAAAFLVAFHVALAGSALVAACDDGEPANSGLTEPILVHGGQFISGPLPGTPAPADGGGPVISGDGGAAAKLPALTVTDVGLVNPLVLPGAAGKSISGRASNDTASIGIAIQGLGTGYWIVPIGDPDPDFPGQDDFGFSADFSASNPPGRRQLLTVAIGPNGNAGVQVETPICLEQRIPDNLHECVKTNPVPRAVFTLQWDVNSDMDLHVILPDGTDVNPKAPITEPLEGGEPPPTIGHIDRDSLRSCIPDGLREEDLIFQDEPPVGIYEVYADLFDSCGLPAVLFNAILSEPGADGNLHPTFTRSGEMIQIQETGGGSRGLFVYQKQFK
jgi:hypothetical protein